MSMLIYAGLALAYFFVGSVLGQISWIVFWGEGSGIIETTFWKKLGRYLLFPGSFYFKKWKLYSDFRGDLHIANFDGDRKEYLISINFLWPLKLVILLVSHVVVLTSLLFSLLFWVVDGILGIKPLSILSRLKNLFPTKTGSQKTIQSSDGLDKIRQKLAEIENNENHFEQMKNKLQSEAHKIINFIDHWALLARSAYADERPEIEAEQLKKMLEENEKQIAELQKAIESLAGSREQLVFFIECLELSFNAKQSLPGKFDNDEATREKIEMLLEQASASMKLGKWYYDLDAAAEKKENVPNKKLSLNLATIRN